MSRTPGPPITDEPIAPIDRDPDSQGELERVLVEEKEGIEESEDADVERLEREDVLKQGAP